MDKNMQQPIERFDIGLSCKPPAPAQVGMVTADEGEWVRYEDHVKAIAALSQKPSIEDEELIETLRHFSEAYPEDIFRPLDDETAKAIHAAYHGAIRAADRIEALSSAEETATGEAISAGILWHEGKQIEHALLITFPNAAELRKAVQDQRLNFTFLEDDR